MTHDNIIESILKDSDHDLSLFSEEAVSDLQRRAFSKSSGGKDRWYVECIVRGKDIQLKPEEIVRQLYAERLMKDYGYPSNRLVFEYPVTMGSTKKSADIIIRDKDRPDTPCIIVEVKKPNSKDGKDQLRSYCHATGAQIGIWTNGNAKKTSYYNRKNPNYFLPITEIPNAEQSLSDILRERFTLRDLHVQDKLATKRQSLKDIIKDMEDEVLANAGVDVFEEVFKLIFTKLYDEFLRKDDKQRIEDYLEDKIADDDERGDFEKRKECLDTMPDENFKVMEFRNTGQTDMDLKAKLQKLFDAAQEQWVGVFPENSKFELTDSHLSVCVSNLETVKLFNSNLMVIDEAFEYLVNKSSKGEKGQYFTPRHVIDMCVRMLSPKSGEYMIDTAAGSCGFPVHTVFELTGHLFTNEEISPEEKEDVLKVFGIDFDEKAVRVARTLNLIAGDGETNVLHLNTLDFGRWGEKTEKDSKWINTYGKGFERLKKLRTDKNQNQKFKFDIVMANPPFAGDIKEKRILHQYQISTKPGKKDPQDKVGRDILFIERNLDFLKPGGRMAVVLPQGRFNNTTDKHIRDFIAENCRILAVVGLHGNTFKPHTGTKTSVLFVQKWDDKLCPKRDNYPIFFAVSKNGGKDNSGDYIYKKDDNNKDKLDNNGHLIVKHDLHNHGGALEDGIAEAFADWAKSEDISFWRDGSGKP